MSRPLVWSLYAALVLVWSSTWVVIAVGLEDIARLAAATAAPLVPLLLTIFSPEELIMRIIKVLF